MDGNGRWAESHGLPVAAGHREGTRALRRTVEAANGDLIAIAAAFDDALGKVIKRLVEWTLTTGQKTDIS